jgi:hypothetical protein
MLKVIGFSILPAMDEKAPGLEHLILLYCPSIIYGFMKLQTRFQKGLPRYW